MNHVLRATRDWAAEIVAGWDRFWFTPTDAATLSLIRVLAGAMLLYTHLVWSLDLEAFFSADGWLRPEAVSVVQRNGYTWSYFWHLHSPAALWTAHVAALLVFTLFMLGVCPRVTSVLAFVAALSYVGRVPGALFGLDQTNLMLSMYLLIGPSGARYSVDRWWARRKQGPLAEPQPSVSANVAIRLMQLHMCIIYLFAGTAKLTGAAWWNGMAMWLAFANYEYQSIDMTWMAHYPALICAMSTITVYWEIFYCALVWPRLTRPVVLLLAVPLHLGIVLCLGMPTFGLIMLVANLAFVSPDLVRTVIRWPGRKTTDSVAIEKMPASPRAKGTRRAAASR